MSKDFEEFNKYMTDDEITEVVGKAKPCPFCNGVAFEVIDWEKAKSVITFHTETCILANRSEGDYKLNPQSGFKCYARYYFSGVEKWNRRFD